MQVNKLNQYLNKVYYSLYISIVLVLLFSAITKILNPDPFIETIKNIFNFDEDIIIGLAAIFPIFELSLAVLLLFKIKEKFTLLLVTSLFFFFLLVAIYGFFF